MELDLSISKTMRTWLHDHPWFTYDKDSGLVWRFENDGEVHWYSVDRKGLIHAEPAPSK